RFEDATFCWSPDRRFFVVNDVTSTIRFVEPDTAREVIRLTGPDATQYSPMCLTPDGTSLIAGTADFSALFVWYLRRIRVKLKELGMDWDLPEFPSTPHHNPTILEADPGFFRQPILKSDRNAVAILGQLRKLQPSNPDVSLHRGMANERLGRRPEAIEDY